MERTHVQRIAQVLLVLVTVVFVCNLIALPLVPGLVYFRTGEDAFALNLSQLQALFAYDVDDGLGHLLGIYLRGVWQQPYTAMLTFFLLFSGACTAVILWQGRRVLQTILSDTPFAMGNAVSLRRAAWGGFAIAAVALVRVIWSVWYYRSPLPLATYNALFVPIFAMGGLLCLVMSALFRQAAELKAESDLTI